MSVDHPILVAGPCAIEDYDTTATCAEELARVAQLHGFDFVFKASFDKANRTSGRSFRGPGLDQGLDTLRRIREALGIRVLCDVHESAQSTAAGEVADILQIPAFLCRQTDLLRSCASTGRTVNLKKGPFLAPWQVEPALEKLMDSGAKEVWVTERGSSFGHGDLVVDFRGLNAMRATGCPLLFDASHAAQKPGARGDRSGGDRRSTPVLARAAAGAGFDGLYLEVHPRPEEALSDPDTQWPLSAIEPLILQFARLWDCQRSLPPLPPLRS
mgnify:CR=1 FL=1